MLTDDAVNVLVVEDADMDAELIQLALRRTGRQVRARRARHPAEALDILGALPSTPALVLVDMRMPGGGGVGLLRDIRARWGRETLPAVVLSSSGERVDVESAYAAGANGYLVKPMSFADLQSMVDAALRFWVDHNHRPAGDPAPR